MLGYLGEAGELKKCKRQEEMTCYEEHEETKSSKATLGSRNFQL
jgi:hypothetical protein